VFVDQHLFAEGRKVQHLRDRGAAVGAHDAGIGGLRAAGIRPHAQRHSSGDAKFAMAAKGGKAGDDVIARLHRLHFGADRAHHARRLVPRNGGHGVGVGPVDEMEIRMAQATRLGVDQDFVRQRIGEFYLADRETTGLFENCGLCHQREAPTSPLLMPALAPALPALAE
jgi:hypothetical protein